MFENNETHFVKCNKCEELFKYNVKTGNSNLIRHIQNCKPISQNQAINNIFKDYSAKKSKIADAAAICCCVDLLPFNFIEGRGFRLLAKELIKCGQNPNEFIDIDKLLPARKTVSNHVNSKYLMLRSRIISELRY